MSGNCPVTMLVSRHCSSIGFLPSWYLSGKLKRQCRCPNWHNFGLFIPGEIMSFGVSPVNYSDSDDSEVKSPVYSASEGIYHLFETRSFHPFAFQKF